jgi:YHS domain-containing protein
VRVRAMVKTANLTVIDPVCGMEVDPVRALWSREAMGQTFYFCSSFCAEIFDPEIDAVDLIKLRANIWGKGHRPRLRSTLWAKDLTQRTIKKLVHFLGGE